MNKTGTYALLFFSLACGLPLQVTGECLPYSVNQNTVLTLTINYNENCYGDSEDLAPISRSINARSHEIEARELALRSSGDLSKHRENVAGMLEEINVSLAASVRNDTLNEELAVVQTALLAATNNVRQGQHEATGWQQDQLKLHGIDLKTKLLNFCPNDQFECREVFTGTESILRHSNLVSKVILESNNHLVELTDAYAKMDTQWDYYFGKARSQYIWELALNSWVYDKKLVRDCQRESGSTFTGDKLKEFCKKRKDVRLAPPPHGQWILIHPTAAFEYTSSDHTDNSASSAVAVVELIGYNWFANGDKFPLKFPIGISAISTVSLDSRGDRFGYGAMVHVKNSFSIGVARRKFGGEAETTWLISADLGKLFGEKKSQVKDKFKFLDL